MSQTHQIDTVQHDERAMSISWIDGHRGRYLHIWLRDNCMCDECGTSISGQRRLRLSDIPETIKPSEVIDIAGSQIKITWPDGHETRYEAKWLRAHCHCAECRAEPRLRLQTWDASLNPESLVQTFEAVMDDDACLFDLIATIVSHGLVRVRGVPEQSTAQLASRIGYLHDTNYGLLLDMKTEASSWFRVMSAEAIPPHTDNVYRYDPTGVTFFHCVQQISGGGGASRYVDAFRIAESLRVSDPDCFDCLSTTPLRFHRHIPANADLKVDAAYFKTESPVFKLDQDGQVIGVRYHPRTLAPLLLDEAEIARVYRSRMKLETLSVDPSMRIEFVSDPGECAIYDHHRVMHSRTGFEGANGVRHFRQCHIDREDLHSRLRLLGAALGRVVPEEQITRGVVG